ncbi:MAG: 3'(2'),5'-bisphosphate nucleotidase CysQ [Candidatus Cyclobacteriaceae bacterium M3_2C_046]
MLDQRQTESIKKLVREAGALIMEVYQNKQMFEAVDIKADNSPLTLADKKSNELITHQLQSIFPEIPIISEEGKDIPYDQRKNYDTFWLVDPLDGTKEFIKRNGEFTVNIALMEKERPVEGFIFAPDLDLLYFTQNGKAYLEKGGQIEKLKVNQKKEGLVGVRSRSHGAPEEEALFTQYKVKDFISIGSSLKFCMIAEGKADIYYRHNPTMEWDTAAGQAIVEAAGGKVYRGTSEEPFTYNKEDLRNGGFLCVGF